MADIVSMLTLGPVRAADFRSASVLTDPARPIGLLVTQEQPAAGPAYYVIRSLALTDGHAYTRQAAADDRLHLAVPATPETAAEGIERTLLPCHDRLLARHRLAVLEEALQGAQWAADHWDLISDRLCDDDGWPLDEQLYSDGKVRRDADTLAHLQRVLPHADALLRDGRAAQRHLPPGDKTDRIGYQLRTLADSFASATRTLDEWTPTLSRHIRTDGAPIEPGHTTAVEERNAELWSDIDTWLTTGPALAALLHGEVGPAAPAGRTAAAEARSPSLRAAGPPRAAEQQASSTPADRPPAPHR